MAQLRTLSLIRCCTTECAGSTQEFVRGGVRLFSLLHYSAMAEEWSMNSGYMRSARLSTISG